MLSKAARLAARKRRQISAPPHAVAHHQRGIGLRFAKLMSEPSPDHGLNSDAMVLYRIRRNDFEAKVKSYIAEFCIHQIHVEEDDDAASIEEDCVWVTCCSRAPGGGA